MPAARTNWHTDRLPTLDLPDPFEAPVEEVGEPIDLSQRTARLNLRLKELIYREGRLDALGITCDLKDERDILCTLCPVSMAGDEDAPLGDLCRVGREQESVCTQLAVESRGAAQG